MSTEKTTGSKTVIHRALTQGYFSPFGTVVENPSPSSTSPILPSESEQARHPVTIANQNTALKYTDVAPMSNSYNKSPSQKPAFPVMNMFVCFPRALTSTTTTTATAATAAAAIEESAAATSKPTTTTPAPTLTKPVFPIQVLERHSYTTQTFIPMGLSADSPTRYLVVVAPTITPSPSPDPDPNNTEPSPNHDHDDKDRDGDRGPPDLDNLRAFWGHGGQAVTYAAGTWHSPMAVIGDKSVDFVVLQFSNGVREEDCEEIKIRDGIAVL